MIWHIALPDASSPNWPLKSAGWSALVTARSMAPVAVQPWSGLWICRVTCVEFMYLKLCPGRLENNQPAPL